MRRIITIAIILSLSLIVVWFVAKQLYRRQREASAYQIQPGDKLTLISIDGAMGFERRIEANAELLDRYPVLGQIDVVDAKLREQILSELNFDLRKGVWIRPAACFYPRHALRITAGLETRDYLICYECSQMTGNNSREHSGIIASNSKQLLDKILTEANIPLAPENN